MSKPVGIVPVSKIDDGYIRIMLYGDPGCGKTRVACTSPRGLILNADPTGTISGALAGSTCDRKDVYNHDDLLDIYEWLKHGGTDDYDWVWLDSITLFQERGLDQIMTDLIASGKDHRKIYLPDKGEFGQNMNRIKLWCRYMTALPINFGITAHVLREEQEDSTILMKPSVQGKGMSDTICGYMGIVAHMYAVRKEQNTVRTIQAFKDSKRVAKDRFDALPGGKLVGPTIPKLEELIKAKLPAQTGKSQTPKTRVRNRTQAQKRTRSVT